MTECMIRDGITHKKISAEEELRTQEAIERYEFLLEQYHITPEEDSKKWANMTPERICLYNLYYRDKLMTTEHFYKAMAQIIIKENTNEKS